MNTRWPQYTETQDARLTAKRAALLERWTTADFRATPTFRITRRRKGAVNRYGVVSDVYEARNSTPSFPAVWRADADRLGFTTKPIERGFDIIVPHAYYLDDRYCCVSVDSSILVKSTFATIFIAACAYLARLVVVL